MFQLIFKSNTHDSRVARPKFRLVGGCFPPEIFYNSDIGMFSLKIKN